MKKLIALLLALLLTALCFVACGTDDEKGNDANGDEAQNEQNSVNMDDDDDQSNAGEDNSGDTSEENGGDEDVKDDEEGKLSVGEDTDGGNYGDFIPYK